MEFRTNSVYIKGNSLRKQATMPPLDCPSHSVLQLHGGGALVLSQLLKCCVIEHLTGKRIHDLFGTVIADSGGSILALSMHEYSAMEVLGLYMEAIQEALPDVKFLLSQSMTTKSKLFDTASLDDIFLSVFGEKTLADYQGNLFVGVHHIEEQAQRVMKLRMADGSISYSPKHGEHISFKGIAKAASAIPGIMPPHKGVYLDPMTDQSPAAILAKLQQAYPAKDIYYLQIGNIHHNDKGGKLQSESLVKNTLVGKIRDFTSLHRHSADLRDAADVLSPDHVHSLMTLSEKHFRSIDNSAEQRTQLVVETLEDIEARTQEYEGISLKLLENAGFANELAGYVEDAIESLKVHLDPYMVRETLLYYQVTEANENQFPKPDIIPAEQTLFYQTGYLAGVLSGKFNTHILPILQRGYNKAMHQLFPASFPAPNAPTQKNSGPA